MLTEEDQEYLLGRGYTPNLLQREEVYSLSAGSTVMLEGVCLKPTKPVIAFVCRAMSGEVIGIHTAARTEHDYNFFKASGKPFLPIFYATQEDREKLFDQGEMGLVEGVFDRIAMRRLAPSVPWLARLSKGTSRELTNLIKRYAKTVWTAFDQDEAGQKGTKKAAGRLNAGNHTEIQLKELNYPAKDPAKLLERYGATVASHIITKQMEQMNF